MQNRELSWLKFNARVLEEATDKSVPLLERLKFIAIFTSNLDEFFMVRVGSLVDLMMVKDKKIIDNKTGWTPKEQLSAIFKTIPGLMEKKDEAYRALSMELREQGIFNLSPDELSESEEEFVERYFECYVNPVLSPQIVDNRHPIPHLENRKLYVAATLKGKNEKVQLGIVPVPSSVNRIISMPQSSCRYIRVETIILKYINDIFDIYEVTSANVISVTRNADISFDEEKFEDNDADYLKHVRELLKKRDWMIPVRLEIEGKYNDMLTQMLRTYLNIGNNQIYYSLYPIKLEYVYVIEKMIPRPLREKLTYTPFTARDTLPVGESMTQLIKQKDRLLFYPFEKIDPFLRLLDEAASDPDVISIKITIYRLASESMVGHALLKAAENGKEVTALMELRARFDESHNIKWSERLKEAGCRVIYGEEGFKCHSKLCLITRRGKNGMEHITQVGTGNYNEKTAGMYTDLCLMTANDAIAKDATQFFQNMLIGNLNGQYDTLLIAPGGLKSKILSLIDDEIKKGPDGRIFMKANSLTDVDVIGKLIEASQAGVKIRMVIRGICCIRPGIYNKTDNISVTSIVGRFLEHSRIYIFGHSDDCRMFISSADLMTRNLNKRVEIAAPVFDESIKKEILNIVDVILKDNVKARVLQPDDTYRKKDPFGTEMIDSQDYFIKNSVKAEPPKEEKPGGLLQKILKLLKIRR